MTSREAFEAQERKHLATLVELVRKPSDEYWDCATERRWQVWQAAIQHATEVAVKVCEERQTPGTGSVAILNGCADAIKEALK